MFRRFKKTTQKASYLPMDSLEQNTKNYGELYQLAFQSILKWLKVGKLSINHTRRTNFLPFGS